MRPSKITVYLPVPLFAAALRVYIMSLNVCLLHHWCFFTHICPPHAPAQVRADSSKEIETALQRAKDAEEEAAVQVRWGQCMGSIHSQNYTLRLPDGGWQVMN